MKNNYQSYMASRAAISLSFGRAYKSMEWCFQVIAHFRKDINIFIRILRNLVKHILEIDKTK